jgi:hypothetical protein
MDPNENDFVNDEPSPAASQNLARPKRRRRRPPASANAGGRWEQTKLKADLARQRTELYLRENPVPMILGALIAGLAIGLAIRYASRSEEKEAKAKLPFRRTNWSFFSLPFLWPFFKSIKEKCEDSAEAVKEGVSRIGNVDVQRYTRPIRNRWQSWTR